MVRPTLPFPSVVLTLAVVALGSSACGGNSPATPSTSSPSGPITVNGTEKIAWDQAADSGSQLAGYQYLAYVDDAPQVLAGVTCGSTATDGLFPCGAPLPKMSSGTHRFDLAAQETGGARLTSPRSSALTLNVAASTAVAPASASPIVRSVDGIELRAETLAVGLSAPSAVSASSDGRVFIANRDGRVLIWQNGSLLATPALQLDDVAQTSDVGLIDVALDREFVSNGRVFVAYTARDPDGSFVQRVLRLRETNGVFGQAAVILEDRAPAAPVRPPRIHIAGDQTAYVAFPGGDQATAESYSSYSGKILRINADGTTPRDNQLATPVVSSGEATIGGFDWHPVTGRLWLSGRDWQGRDFIRNFTLGPSGAATFESLVDPSGAAFYAPSRIAGFANDLFISALNGRHLRRAHFSASDPNRIEITERLFDGQFGRISAVAVGPDGALYFCTSNTGTTTATSDDDRLVRVTQAN